jgi:hypothetical protein
VIAVPTTITFLGLLSCLFVRLQRITEVIKVTYLVQAMNTRRGNGSTVLPIRDFGNRRKWAVNSIPSLLKPRKVTPPVHWVVPDWSGHFGRRKISCFCQNTVIVVVTCTVVVLKHCGPVFFPLYLSQIINSK